MREGARYGAITGILCWLIGGIILGAHLGGYGAVSILSKLTGGPIDSGIFSRMFVLVGMCVGVICTGTSAIVVGSLGGAVLGALLTRNTELTFGETK